MTMKDMEIKQTPGESPAYEEYYRLSPQAPEFPADPYRCPVSTPADNRRAAAKAQPTAFVTFTNLNRSLRMPRNLTEPKTQASKLLKNRRQTAKPQKKNFSDCYFVNKIERPIHVDAQIPSTKWLTSLCSQPVEEIFGKYKRKTEAAHLSKNAFRTRNVSTPGEKALLNAWSSNSSNRGTPTITSHAAPTNTPRLSTDPNLRVYGFDHDPDRMMPQPGFALMPIYLSDDLHLDDVTCSSRSSPIVQKQRLNINNNTAFSDVASSVGSSIYEAYQRERKFPEIKYRKGTYSPAKKRVVTETKESNTPTQLRQELEESPIQIISIGQFDNIRPLSDENSDISHKDDPLSKPCSYRLSLTLPELKGKG